MSKYKMMSLFSGSGGFELAATLCGIEPVAASEVEPYPIAVTRSRFPSMKHLGSVTDINGAEIEPVDIITFGSPCQDLSVAGKRAGLKHEANGDEETTRSGLFMEAVRIIKEMRAATNGVYPRFALWENVPGAFSSNKGEDFRIVLQELIQIVEPTAKVPPMPKGGWPYADVYMGGGWSLAYRTFDAQYWGVPQRRRRIHLIADFTGECAGKVLFEREGVRGYFAACGETGQGTAADAERGIGADDRKGNCITLEPGIAAREGGHIYEGVSGTLRANAGDNQMSVAYYEGHSQDMRAKEITDGTTPTLSAGMGMGGANMTTPMLIQQVAYSVENHPADSRVNLDESGKVQTLTSRMDTGGGNVPMVMEAVSISSKQQSLATSDNLANTLGANDYKEPQAVVYCLQGNGIDRADTAGCNGKGWKEDTCYTLNTIDRPAVAFQTYQKVTDPLMANSHPGSYTGQDAFSDMLVAGKEENPVVLDRAFFNQGENAKFDPQFYTDGTVPTLVARGPAAVAEASYVDTSHADDVVRIDTVTAPLQARDYKGGKLVCVRYIVRRLTPTECARLQGFADRWGEIDHKEDFTDEEYSFWCDVYLTKLLIDGTVMYNDDGDLVYTNRRTLYKPKSKPQLLKWYNGLRTDSAEYKLWGNGIALPPAVYCMQGIVDALVNAINY